MSGFNNTANLALDSDNLWVNALEITDDHGREELRLILGKILLSFCVWIIQIFHFNEINNVLNK